MKRIHTNVDVESFCAIRRQRASVRTYTVMKVCSERTVDSPCIRRVASGRKGKAPNGHIVSRWSSPNASWLSQREVITQWRNRHRRRRQLVLSFCFQSLRESDRNFTIAVGMDSPGRALGFEVSHDFLLQRTNSVFVTLLRARRETSLSRHKGAHLTQ